MKQKRRIIVSFGMGFVIFLVTLFFDGFPRPDFAPVGFLTPSYEIPRRLPFSIVMGLGFSIYFAFIKKRDHDA